MGKQTVDLSSSTFTESGQVATSLSLRPIHEFRYADCELFFCKFTYEFLYVHV